MLVRFHAPLGDGKKWEEVVPPIPRNVNELFKRLCEMNPKIKQYIRPTVEETMNHVLLFRSDYILKSEDIISREDRIVIMMPICGG